MFVLVQESRWPCWSQTHALDQRELMSLLPPQKGHVECRIGIGVRVHACGVHVVLQSVRPSRITLLRVVIFKTTVCSAFSYPNLD